MAAQRFLAAGQAFALINTQNPALLPWRSQAALALARCGQRAEALRLAGEEVELARRFGAKRAIGIALRTRALVQQPVSLELLRESAATLASGPARLEHARSQIELGAALRRRRERAAAREPLRAGLDLAVRCGAPPLAARAHDELLAAGARPRRLLRSGVEALTASERRVAAMAAQGLSNPEIAQALFVTPRTIEAHLSRAYAKLGVASRRQLGGVLSPPAPAVGSSAAR